MTLTPALRDAATRWIADDPDPSTRDELTRVLAGAMAGTPGAAEDLADRMSAPLRFGTAGLRGAVRAGPAGMNVAVVTRATAGLAAWLARAAPSGPAGPTGRFAPDGALGAVDRVGSPGPVGSVVVGRDARHGSEAFAAAAAGVFAGAGFTVHVLPAPLPTPVLAFAVRHLGAVAGVQVTASHNPAGDNGYKVYLADGAQLAPPADGEIEAAIAAAPPARSVPTGTAVITTDVTGAYLDRTARLPRGGARGLRVALTPMHGVGGETAVLALARAGFTDVHVVAAQAVPDPDFPTVAFPNPEEPGAMDALLALAAEVDADLAIALDPDADRCALAVPRSRFPLRTLRSPATRWSGTADSRQGGTDAGPDSPTQWSPDPDSRQLGPDSRQEGSGSRFRVLTGDETGVLLGDHILRSGGHDDPLVATTVVSSSMLRAVAAAHGARFAETLTGFKWIVRGGPGLVYGYEEALGYCVDPDAVRDKDGMAAAVLACDLAATLKTAGQTLGDRLDELAAAHGVHATLGVSLRMEAAARDAAVARLRDAPPPGWAGERPAPDVLVLRRPGERLVIRPSGTEPKLKAYLEVVEPPGPDVPAARVRAADRLDALRAEVEALLAP